MEMIWNLDNRPFLSYHRNKAIADYFQQCGYTQTLERFKEETNMQDDIEKRFANLLEKKWTSVIRLQRKVFCLFIQVFINWLLLYIQ